MACHAVRMWSLTGLVAAFLDLTIAYLMLCGSVAAYLASKFLGFFGLSLLCPCDGVFMNVHTRSLCLNRLLVDFPIQKLSDVQLSVRQKCPFGNSVSPEMYDSSGVDDDCSYEILELEGEASCSSSISDAREWSSRIGKIDLKGKGALSNRPKSRLRQWKMVGGHRKNSSLFSYDSPVHDEVIDEQAYHHFSGSKIRSWSTVDGVLPADNAANHNLEFNEAPKKPRARLKTLSRDQMNVSSDRDTHMKKSIVCSEEVQDYHQGVQGCGGDANSKIKLLERALENERAARDALCIDLEEERSAAASAADEAMAMILRLQEEKASIEMEARQYERIIQEKSAYDDEEMNILEEILVRREKEKLFLEKEVEAYRQMVSRDNDQLTGDFSSNNDARQMFGRPNDDPVSPLHQLAASTDKNIRCADNGSESKFNSKPALVTESPFRHLDEQSNFGSEKMDSWKEIIPIDKDIQWTHNVPLECEELEQEQDMNQGQKLSKTVVRARYGIEKGDPSLKQQAKDAAPGYRSSCDPIPNEDPRVYDVHVVGDDINLGNEASQDKGETDQRNITADSPSACRLESEAVARKSSPEGTSCLPPIGKRGLSHGLRRRSTSSVDTEMLKIDTEIIQLQGRLKHVQEEKEKLGISLEYRESKSSQLRILEDIAQQIRRLTPPERRTREASLPLPNSKGSWKRRRSRSVSSSGFRRSSEGMD